MHLKEGLLRARIETERERHQTKKMERQMKRNWNRRKIGQTLRIKQGPLLSEADLRKIREEEDEARREEDDYSHDADFD